MKTILLVEDDPFLIDIYTTKLKEAGFSVKVAKDGEEAIRKIKEHNPRTGVSDLQETFASRATALKGKRNIWPDLILLDIVLPQIEGWEILKEIRENLNLKDLKIVILSNLGQKEEIEKGLKLGATEYLIKAHYTPSEVVEKIKKILE